MKQTNRIKKGDLLVAFDEKESGSNPALVLRVHQRACTHDGHVLYWYIQVLTETWRGHMEICSFSYSPNGLHHNFVIFRDGEEFVYTP